MCGARTTGGKQDTEKAQDMEDLNHSFESGQPATSNGVDCYCEKDGSAV